MAGFIRACVVSRLNIIISGGTGSGKTTLLNILSSFIPEDERIVTIEDAAELKLQQDHVVRLETKMPNADGKGIVSIRELVRNALRMRPDRIIVGECRSGEALDMLQAMNTGHDGSLTTLHANAPRDAISRLETMCLMSGMELPIRVIREQIASAIDLIIQQTRLKDGTRKVTSITEVSGMEGDTIVMTEIFKFEQTGFSSDGRVLGDLKPTGIRPLFGPRLEASGFKLGPEIFGANLSDIFSQRSRR
jgi:pilus assembly protein CpaF